MPQIKLPEVRLPEGLRKMRPEDIQTAVSDVRLPRVDLGSIDIGKEMRRRGIDLSKVELPDAIEGRLPAAIDERLPHHHRRSRFRSMLVAWFVIGTAAWLVFASPLAPRIRGAISGLLGRLGMNGSRGMDELDVGSDTTSLGVYESSGTGRSPVGVGPGTGMGAGTESTGSVPGSMAGSAGGTMGSTAGVGDTDGATGPDTTTASTASASTSTFGGSAADEYAPGTTGASTGETGQEDMAGRSDQGV